MAKMLIGGVERASSDGRSIDVINPATLQTIDSIPNGTADDARAAVDCAAEDYAWAETTMLYRTEILTRFVNSLNGQLDELAELVTAETGKPIHETRYEAKYCAEVFRVFRDEAPRALTGIASPLDAQFAKTDAYYLSRREPAGVVVAILSFNHPAELFAYKVAPALLAGNRVIVKPSSDAPLAPLKLTQMLLDAGVPGTALQCVTGSGARIGDALVGDQRVQCVSFTGSTDAGGLVFRRGAQHFAKVILELGGNDPLLVLPDADLEWAVKLTADGRTEAAGQSCTANKRMIVHRDVAKEFTERLLAALANDYPLGDPMDPGTRVGPLINKEALDTVEDQVRLTLTQGAMLAQGGERISDTYYRPAVLTSVTPEMEVARDLEIFGPVFPIIVANSRAEMLSIANQTHYGLNAGVFTSSIKDAFWFATKLACGQVVVNGGPMYRPYIHSHGGPGLTGSGREGLRRSFDELTVEKGISFRNVLGNGARDEGGPS